MKTKNPVTLSLNHCDFSIIRLHFTFKITYKTQLLEKKKIKINPLKFDHFIHISHRKSQLIIDIV